MLILIDFDPIPVWSLATGVNTDLVTNSSPESLEVGADVRLRPFCGSVAFFIVEFFAVSVRMLRVLGSVGARRPLTVVALGIVLLVLLLITSVLLPRDVVHASTNVIEPVTVAQEPTISVWSVRTDWCDFMLTTRRDDVSLLVAGGSWVEIPAGNESGPFRLAVDGGSPLYRCYAEPFHFFSTDSRCKGHTNEGRLGYVRWTPSAAFPRLLRVCYKWRGWQHYHSLDAPCRSGDLGGGALGYVASAEFQSG